MLDFLGSVARYADEAGEKLAEFVSVGGHTYYSGSNFGALWRA